MYNSFISLGCHCGTAASMTKHGVRSFAGPFDWCVSDFDSVLHFIETDFINFLSKENLKVVKGKIKDFEDIKYHIYFNHDMKSDLEKEYSDICNKYSRRIAKFLSAIKSEVCFIRAVRNEEELLYISNNKQYIDKVIKRHNARNEIIYLVPKYMKIPQDFNAKYYILDPPKGILSSREELRAYLDTNTDLITFLQENYYAISQRNNIIFDLRQENDLLQQKSHRLQERYDFLLKLVNFDFNKINIPPEIAIYGAGTYGTFFYDRIKEKCKIKCFIDANSSAKTYDDTLMVNPSTYTHAGETIIVTPVFAFEEIRATLEQIYFIDNSRIISLESHI